MKNTLKRQIKSHVNYLVWNYDLEFLYKLIKTVSCLTGYNSSKVSNKFSLSKKLIFAHSSSVLNFFWKVKYSI